MNNFLQEFETLKKEVWFLKNKTIKDLTEEVAMLTGGEVDSTLTGKINSLEESVAGLESGLKSLEVVVNSNSDNIVDVSEHVGELSTVISSIQEDIVGINSQIEALKDTDELMSGNINTLSDNLSKVEQSVDDLTERVNGLSGGIDLSALQADIEALKVSDSQQNFDIGGIKTTQANNISLIDHHTAKIGVLQEEMDVLQEDIVEIKADIEQLQSSGGGGGDTTAIEQQLAKHESDISSLNTSVGELEQTLSEIENEVDTISTEQTAIKLQVNTNSASITSLQESDSNQNEDISSLNDTTSSLSTSIANVEAVATTNSQTLASLQAEIDAMKSKLDNVKSQRVVVLYDKNSTDASVNLGYTAGVTGYLNLMMDLTPYSRLRVFCSLYASDVQKEIDLVNRQRTDISFVASHTNAKNFYLFKVNIPTNKARLSTMAYSIWTWDATNSVLSVEQGKSNDNIFVYRIEGIIEE